MKQHIVGIIPSALFVAILLFVNDLVYGHDLSLWQAALYGFGVIIAIEILVRVERSIKQKSSANR